MPPRAHPKIFFQRDLGRVGITWTRQHTNRKVRAKEFPPPDGKTSDAPSAPNFWFDHTIYKYLRQRAVAMREQAAAIAEHAATMRMRAAAVREAKHAASSSKLSNQEQLPALHPPARQAGNQGGKEGPERPRVVRRLPERTGPARSRERRSADVEHNPCDPHPQRPRQR